MRKNKNPLSGPSASLGMVRGIVNLSNHYPVVQESIKHFPIPLLKSLKVIAEGDFLVILLAGLLIFSLSFAEGQFVYDSKLRRDPFIPLVTPDGRILNLDRQENASDLTLEGIIFDPQGSSYAIINGEVAKAGSNIGNCEIVRIEKNKVFFAKDGQLQELELNP